MKVFAFKNKKDLWYLGKGEINSINNRFEGIILGTEDTSGIGFIGIISNSSFSMDYSTCFEIGNLNDYKKISETICALFLRAESPDFDMRKSRENNPSSRYNLMIKKMKENESFFRE